MLRANLERVAARVNPLNPKGASLDLSTSQRVEATDPHAGFVPRVSLRLANIEDATRTAAAIVVVIW
ncbi:MAG TPA: hypothetical protein VGS97_10220 [Actinocrinis sp.]|uniref:hypothetical protein n=1 Tax=Actinocrinis sp. TaxID=1920516 RepID=UPI002DDCCB67|nr:hypothetical protein [Actinocrinis sp.]HEV2344455.1 hypothetical protein [Actinocrinis sp.]